MNLPGGQNDRHVSGANPFAPDRGCRHTHPTNGESIRMDKLMGKWAEGGIRNQSNLIEVLWLRGKDLNLRPLGYEPNELPDCSTPQLQCNKAANGGQ